MNSNRDNYLAAAHQIGARLCRDAVWAQSRCNWLGSALAVFNGTQTLVECAAGPDLYSGTAGIALFLARLYAATGEKTFRTAAIGALNQAWSRHEDILPRARLGFYSGWLGVAYARLVTAESLGQEDQSMAALTLIETLTRMEPDPLTLDVMSGSAGAIPVLLELNRRCRKDWLIAFAVRHGSHLLKTARRRDEGWSWRTLQMSTRDDLTGFSHGAAGIAWALLELYYVTRENRWRTAAEEAFRYERRWFNTQETNWGDLRILDNSPATQGSTPPCSMAWCHGAPGISLSRIRAWKIMGEDIWRREAEAALGTTAKSLDSHTPSQSDNFSLCHGRAGNAEILLYASQVLDRSYLDIAESVAQRGIRFYHSTRAAWPCGVYGGGETPSLLLGLAGIGYFYLRMFNPDATPPVLIVHPTSSSPRPTRRTASRLKSGVSAET